MSQRILVIDDEEDIRALMKLILEAAGFQVTLAHNGQEGLAAIATHGADLVVLDILLPDLNGWEICRRLKADPATQQIPIIILTVRSLFKDQLQFDQLQLDGFISKPFEIHDLLTAVRKLLPPTSAA